MADAFISRLFESIWADSDDEPKACGLVASDAPSASSANGPAASDGPLSSSAVSRAASDSLSASSLIGPCGSDSPSAVPAIALVTSDSPSASSTIGIVSSDGLSASAAVGFVALEGPSASSTIGLVAVDAPSASLPILPLAIDGPSASSAIGLGASSASASVVGSTASHMLDLLNLGPALRALHHADHLWWHDLVHSGHRQQIAAYDGLVWKMPLRHEDPLTHCMCLLRRLVRNDSCYYVGITESPIRRWEAHSRKYTTMYLVYVAATSRTTASLEMAILHKVAFGSLMCENNSLGGEAASSGTPHYLYVAVRESGLLRGNYREPKRSRFGSCDVAEDIRRWGGGR